MIIGNPLREAFPRILSGNLFGSIDDDELFHGNPKEQLSRGLMAMARKPEVAETQGQGFWMSEMDQLIIINLINDWPPTNLGAFPENWPPNDGYITKTLTALAENTPQGLLQENHGP